MGIHLSGSTSIFTIGYGSRTFEVFGATLREHGVNCLVDVRSIPGSRYRPEFSRSVLEAALKQQGIRYHFLGDALGGRPEASDCYVDGKVDYDRVREKDFYQRGIDQIRGAYEQGIVMAIMCAEGRPEECHRTRLIGSTLHELALPVTHLDEQGRLCTQPEVIERLTGGQLNLFGETSFTSRKRYGDDRSLP